MISVCTSVYASVCILCIICMCRSVCRSPCVSPIVCHCRVSIPGCVVWHSDVSWMLCPDAGVSLCVCSGQCVPVCVESCVRGTDSVYLGVCPGQ